MLSKTLKHLRKSKGLSQEELTTRLHVVRQTVSKWEHGLSVPDAEMLVKIARELETSVAALLGDVSAASDDHETASIAIAQRFLNEQRRKRWRRLCIVTVILASLLLLQALIGFLHWQIATNAVQHDPTVIGGTVTPTNIFVSRAVPSAGMVVAALLAMIGSAIGIRKTKRP